MKQLLILVILSVILLAIHAQVEEEKVSPVKTVIAESRQLMTGFHYSVRNKRSSGFKCGSNNVIRHADIKPDDVDFWWRLSEIENKPFSYNFNTDYMRKHGINSQVYLEESNYTGYYYIIYGNNNVLEYLYEDNEGLNSTLPGNRFPNEYPEVSRLWQFNKKVTYSNLHFNLDGRDTSGQIKTVSYDLSHNY